MTISYPNRRNNVVQKSQKNNEIKVKSNNTYSNRGMSLEDDLNATNTYYLSNNIANIHKKPTPVQIVKVDYPKRSAAVIREAYFKQPSTTDYNGIYKGKYIDFEAKETNNKTSFPLQNFHLHQIQHMENVLNHGGISFVIIKFSLYNEIYFMKATDILTFWKRQTDGGRKSISRDECKEYGTLLKPSYPIIVPYLKCIDELFVI
ncbi:Holliday junction resolvase RecU [Bacillus sp. AL-1R]